MSKSLIPGTLGVDLVIVIGLKAFGRSRSSPGQIIHDAHEHRLQACL